MVWLFVKATIAAIPAFIILVVIGLLVTVVLGVTGALWTAVLKGVAAK